MEHHRIDGREGLRRQNCRGNGLHPIKDRAAIAELIPVVLVMAKQLKRRAPKAKYRFMLITDSGPGRYSLTSPWQPVGPMM
jgi:hypothetical protein